MSEDLKSQIQSELDHLQGIIGSINRLLSKKNINSSLLAKIHSNLEVASIGLDTILDKVENLGP